MNKVKNKSCIKQKYQGSLSINKQILSQSRNRFYRKKEVTYGQGNKNSSEVQLKIPE